MNLQSYSNHQLLALAIVSPKLQPLIQAELERRRFGK